VHASLERNLERTDEILKGDETEKMIDLDKEFHCVLYRASRSKKLYQICKTLSDHTLKFRIACIHIPEVAQRTREGHYGVYQAIRSGDAEKVDASIERHILVTKDDILNFLRQMRQESFLNQDFEL